MFLPGAGHNYALELAKALNINDSGGAVRIGAMHYNTPGEIDAVVCRVAGHPRFLGYTPCNPAQCRYPITRK